MPARPRLPLPARVTGTVTRPLTPLVTLLLVTALAITIAPAPSADGAPSHQHRTRWDCLAHYESTHRWRINTGNGHYGGLQFSLRTWRAYGGVRSTGRRYPHKASRKAQIRIAKRVAWHGWGPHRPQGGRNAWPNTWRRCF